MGLSVAVTSIRVIAETIYADNIPYTQIIQGYEYKFHATSKEISFKGTMVINEELPFTQAEGRIIAQLRNI